MIGQGSSGEKPPTGTPMLGQGSSGKEAPDRGANADCWGRDRLERKPLTGAPMLGQGSSGKVSLQEGPLYHLNNPCYSPSVSGYQSCRRPSLLCCSPAVGRVISPSTQTQWRHSYIWTQTADRCHRATTISSLRDGLYEWRTSGDYTTGECL